MKNEATPKTAQSRPAVAPAYKEKAKKKKKQLLYLRTAMLVVCSLILVVGLTLVILPLFRIKNIEVSGNSLYSAEEIIGFSGLFVGQESLQVNLQKVADTVDNADYIKEVRVQMSSPFTIRIQVVEETPLVTAHNGTYYTFDQNFNVLEESESPDAFASFLQVKLPEIAHIAVGEAICFADATMDMSYLFEMTALLCDTGLMPYVTLLDGTQKANTSFSLGENCRIEMGKAEALESKLSLAQEVLLQLGVKEGSIAVVNVSNPQKPTYRTEYPGEIL